LGWTTDAPFRETAAEVEQYRKEGVLAVDMEAAAVFAAGQRLGVQAAALFAIGDSVSEVPSSLVWRLDFDFRKTLRGLEILSEAALRAQAA
jgi:nucleoside phosphorylase